MPLVTAAGASESPKTLKGSETILLVEDDDQVRAVACTILRKNGYHVIEARNAGEASFALREASRDNSLAPQRCRDALMSGPDLRSVSRAPDPTARVLGMPGYTDDSIAPTRRHRGEAGLPPEAHYAGGFDDEEFARYWTEGVHEGRRG